MVAIFGATGDVGATVAVVMVGLKDRDSLSLLLGACSAAGSKEVSLFDFSSRNFFASLESAATSFSTLQHIIWLLPLHIVLTYKLYSQAERAQCTTNRVC